ncbi:MAG: DUF169 domain-containing protein [Desulfobacterales bacterium]|nr:DUF169 domain-containing protein [Desulfobacterales bacterium]
MNSEIIKESLHKLSETMSFKYPAIGWYFSPEEIENSFVFKKDKWVCMFMYLKMVINKGKRIRFSEDYGNACGAAECFGFTELTGSDGKFIAETERFKQNRKLAQSYYKESLKSINSPKEKYLYMEQIETIEKNREIEVINLFPDVTGLAKLTVLSNYDRESNMDNVLTPFASGCQSVFTVPYNEKFQEKPKSVIGLMDTLVRQFVPDDMLSFSVPANRFVEMANNIEGSFLDKNFKNPKGF